MQTAVAIASVRTSLAAAIGCPERRMTAHTSSAPRTALASVASRVTPHTPGSMIACGPSRAWKIVAASAPPSQKSVTLKATLTGDWPRLTISTTIGPSRMPSSIAHGSAKMSPKTSGSSLSEKMWTLRRNSTWTTHSSATANAAASSHQPGRGSGPSASRCRTCRSVSASALAPIAPMSAQTRGWPPGRRRRRPRRAGVLRRFEPRSATAQPSPQEEPPHDEPPHELPPQEEPPHEEPPHEEPPQELPPHEEPPQDEPPHFAPPHLAPPHLAPPQFLPSGPTGPTSAWRPLPRCSDQLGDHAADRRGREQLARGGRVGARRGERARDVEPARTLGVGPRSGQRVGVGLDDRLDLVGRQVGPALEHQRDGAGDDRGGLRGAAALEQGVAHARLGMREVERRVRVAQARDRAPGRDEVGVAAVAAARPVGHDVVGDVGRAVEVVGADGEHEGVVAGREQAVVLVALVAGGDHHDDAGLPGLLDRVGQQVALVARRRRAEGEVEDADVHAVVVAVRDDPADRGHDRGEGRRAVGAGGLDVDQARARARRPGSPRRGRCRR